jgi:tRNA pseudouridine55 synthase
VTASGLLVIDKPGGMTSHDVVGRVRRILGTRKVGHAGTLDPMATGVLVVGVERATRLLGHLALRDKCYEATIRLGSSTVTDDAEGEVLVVAPSEAVQALDDGDIAASLARMVGTIQQRPSSVSAVKVDGRRAYDRVRSGEDVDLPARTVVVSRIDVRGMRWEPGHVDVDVVVECSTGTYIRAIARDAGDDLGVGGHLTMLRRTRVGPFDIADAVGLDALEESGEAALASMPAVARACFPLWPVDDAQAAAVRNGRRIPWTGPDVVEGPVAVVDASGEFLALASDDAGTARYAAVFA